MNRKSLDHFGEKIYHKDITQSTNLDVKELADQGEAEGIVVCAKLQTQGRGRRGRSWLSKSGDDLLFSLLLRPNIRPDDASQITLLMALAVTRTLREYYAFDARIKWPNDVVISGKKVCGILTELYLDNQKTDYIIVGCGVNVNRTDIPDELKEIATSLALERKQAEGGSIFSIEEILQGILSEFEKYYERFLENGSLVFFTEEYNEWLVSRDKEVKVLDPKGEYVGISKGINDTGELLVELPDGVVTEVYAGEVSVRGLYGYV